MGTPQPTMAATQILVALCVVGSAVAEALAAAAAAEQAAAEQAAAEAEAAAAAAAEAERIKAAQAEAARRQQIAAAAAAEKNAFDSQVSADLGPMVNPVYNFEYKVADDEEKTYISRNAERDGDELSGSYSFIDATGALVTVDYTAGVNGYAETRSKEAGKVTMKAVPAWDGPLLASRRQVELLPWPREPHLPAQGLVRALDPGAAPLPSALGSEAPLPSAQAQVRAT